MPFILSRNTTKKKTQPKFKKLTLEQQKITRQFVTNLKKNITRRKIAKKFVSNLRKIVTKKKETKIDNTCAICLNEMKPSNTITLQCGHQFHKLCMYNTIVTSDVYNSRAPVYDYDWEGIDDDWEYNSDDSDESSHNRYYAGGNGSPPDSRTFIYKCPLCRAKITDPTILKELNRTGKKQLKKLYSEHQKCVLSRRPDRMKCEELWRTYLDANHKHNEFMIENGLIEESSPSSSLSSISSKGSR